MFTPARAVLQPPGLSSALSILASALPAALTLLRHRYLLVVHPNGCSRWAFRTSPSYLSRGMVSSAGLCPSRAAGLLFLRSCCSALKPSPTPLFDPFTTSDSATASSPETLAFLGLSRPSSRLPGCTLSSLLGWLLLFSWLITR